MARFMTETTPAHWLKYLLFATFLQVSPWGRADELVDFVQPLLAEKCVRCHGGEDLKGEINLKKHSINSQLLSQPELVSTVLDTLELGQMPPEGEPDLSESDRSRMVVALKSILRKSVADTRPSPLPLRRLNRLQYNNAVKDIFQLRRDIFSLPEKLMTRQTQYLQTDLNEMPAKVEVTSHSMQPLPGLQRVNPFPKDLRASHGFDNQASQLTLSPLLLDTFLQLSVSILESPDFNEQNVGIWKTFFRAPPKDLDLTLEIRNRLTPFLGLAFRSAVSDETIDRYVAYTLASLDRGLPFSDSMKKTASAALSSPLFLYRSSSESDQTDLFELASNLSFFLWNSGPDQQLLDLAATGELKEPEILHKTIDRMFSDAKIERFLDAFPAQWMQLENVLAVTPDPKQNRYFRLDSNFPASLQMVLEPLLVFDMVFFENRPIRELINPPVVYQSDFLKTWYNSELKPPVVDRQRILAENKEKETSRQQLQATIESHQLALGAFRKSIRDRLLKKIKNEPDAQPPVDLKPYAAWEFNGDLTESIRSLDLEAHGGIEFIDDKVVLNHAYLLSKNLPIDLKAKTLEVWCEVHDLNQRGGGVMGIQGPGDFFDTIVLGERQDKHWISGSNGFSRTKDFPESTPETKIDKMLHLVMVYKQDGTTSLYRDGKPYGKPYRHGEATFPKDRSSVIFGLRHVPAADDRYLSVTIDKARLYDRALTPEEVAASASGNNFYVTEQQLRGALSEREKHTFEHLSESIAAAQTSFDRIPPSVDPAKAQEDAQRVFDDDLRQKLRSPLFERVAVNDPRYGGVITNAAMLSMTSGPTRTHPIARGAWIIEVILNDPPPPPPNDIPPLDEDAADMNLTIREKFSVHRENANCAGCHSRLDPLGFALENFDITGRWRDRYQNGRDVDATGTLMRKYEFSNVVQFKQALVNQRQRFAKAFTAHLLRYALARELTPADSIAIEEIVANTNQHDHSLRELIRELLLHRAFAGN